MFKKSIFAIVMALTMSTQNTLFPAQAEPNNVQATPNAWLTQCKEYTTKLDAMSLQALFAYLAEIKMVQTGMNKITAKNTIIFFMGMATIEAHYPGLVNNVFKKCYDIAGQAMQTSGDFGAWALGHVASPLNDQHAIVTRVATHMCFIILYALMNHQDLVIDNALRAWSYVDGIVKHIRSFMHDNKQALIGVAGGAILTQLMNYMQQPSNVVALPPVYPTVVTLQPVNSTVVALKPNATSDKNFFWSFLGY